MERFNDSLKILKLIYKDFYGKPLTWQTIAKLCFVEKEQLYVISTRNLREMFSIILTDD